MLVIVVNLLGGNLSPSHHTTYCVFSRCHAFIRLYILEKISGVDVKAQDILRKAAHAPRSSDWRGVQVWRISKARMVAHLWNWVFLA